MALEFLDTAEMRRLTDAIFESVFEDPPWTSFLRSIRSSLSCCYAGILLRRHLSGQTFSGCHYWDADVNIAAWQQENLDRFEKEDMFPISRLVPGRILSIEDLMPRSEFVQTPYYRDILHPVGHHHILILCLGEAGGFRAQVFLARREDDGDFGPKDRQFCQRILPNLQTAFRHFSILKSCERERDAYRNALTGMGVGTLILDENRRVLSVDQVATGIIRRSTAMTLNHDRLSFSAPEKRAEFDALCNELVDNTGGEKQRAMHIRHRDGPDLKLLLRHMPNTHEYGGPSRDVLTVFISDPEVEHLALSAELVAQMFGMTRAEAGVAALLLRGCSIIEIAAELDLSELTVRSYLKLVFAKAGVNRQMDFVRVVANSVAALAAEPGESH